jgi:hypothetical protein
MDRTGPENKGTGTGRRLGRCRSASSEKFDEKLGIGQGKRIKAGGGEGKGKRLRSGQK